MGILLSHDNNVDVTIFVNTFFVSCVGRKAVSIRKYSIDIGEVEKNLQHISFLVITHSILIHLHGVYIYS